MRLTYFFRTLTAALAVAVTVLALSAPIAATTASAAGVEAKLQKLLPTDPQKREATINKLRTRIEVLLPKAQEGDADAQFELATWLLVLGQRESAVQWYRAAATLGHEKAQSTLAALSSEGIGEGNKLVYEWAKQQAATGNAEAQYRLGDMLVWGRNGAQRDIPLAVQWLEKSADQGHVLAAYQLGMVYLGGQLDGKSDPEKAVPHISKAAEAGHVPAQRKMAELYLGGTGVEQDVAKSLEMFLRAGESGDTASLYDAAVMIDNGQGTDAPDPERALALYRRAADAGHVPAQLALANLYLSDDSAAKDEKAAAEWMTRAAKNGSSQAMLLLASLYEKGIGVKASPTRSFEWLKEAADAGLPDAQYTLSRKYLSGDNIPANATLAASWATRAALLGHESALNDATYYHFNGYGTEQDFEKAYEFGRLALRGTSGAVYPDTLFIMGVLEQIGGENHKPDPVAAIEHFAAAAEAGHPMAHLSLAYMAHKGAGTGSPNPALAFEHAYIAAMLLPEASETDREKALKIVTETSGAMDEPTLQAAKEKATSWLSAYETQN